MAADIFLAAIKNPLSRVLVFESHPKCALQVPIRMRGNWLNCAWLHDYFRYRFMGFEGAAAVDILALVISFFSCC